MKTVIVESPFAGKSPEEASLFLRYGRACLHDCLMRGEAPYASHLLYTQEGVLDDNIDDQRSLGIKAGFVWKLHAHLTVVYTDFGISRGMQQGIDESYKLERDVEYRSLRPEDLERVKNG